MKKPIVIDPFLIGLVLLVGVALLFAGGCNRSFGEDRPAANQVTSEDLPRFEDRKSVMPEETDQKHPVPTREELKQKLTPEQYNVIVKKGTEPPFTHDYNDLKEKGVFECAACGQPLFTSETKFDSGTGWPSFYQPVTGENVEEVSDDTYGMRRTEVVCSNCGAHLGHVFNDGPKPTGMRYCINGASLQFEPKDESQSESSE